ncbi:MAG: TonB-dependent receptor [Flavobacteriaceae bacterium]|nr:TonB-dependent receptor [Flavobacteriaceae bacterium]
MRIIIISALFCLFTIKGFSQNSELISITFENLSVTEAIKSLEEKTGAQFYYLDAWFNNDVKVNGDFNDTPIEEIMRTVLKNTVINFYVYEGNRIILSKNNAIHDKIPDDNRVLETTAAISLSNPVFYQAEESIIQTDTVATLKIGKEEQVQLQKTYTLSGYVRSSSDNKALSNVAISIESLGVGTTTDDNGYYELKLATGSYVIRTSSLDTRASRKRVEIFNDGTLNFNLQESFESLEEVVVEADADRNVKETQTGVTKIDVEGIKNIPLVMGERDILKVATTLPGITTTGEGSNGYNVRGGKTDQNLILLDNASIYNPSHLFGIFSAINPYTSGEVEIYKGNIPAEYGGRLSSVFNITTKDANTETFSGEASIGTVTSNITLELPVVKEKAGIMVGARSTYSDWIIKNLDNEDLNNSEASFYDVILKYNHELSDKDDLRMTAYYSKDKFKITSDSLHQYSNRLFSLGWRHEFNNEHNGELTLSNSEYRFSVTYDGDFSDDFDLKYRNNETELKAKLNYQINDNTVLTYGLSSKLYNIEPGSVEPLNSSSNVSPLNLEKEKGLESALFASTLVNLNEKLSFDVGLRYSFFAFLGPTTQRTYEANLPKSEATLVGIESFDENEVVKSYGGLEARASIRYFIADDFSIKGSYNNSNQYIHTLSTNTTVSPTDTWKLSDNNIKPQKAEQFSLGLYKNFDNNNYEVSVEGYYKNYDNILDYKVGAQLLLNETLETEVLQGEGKSYGVEFLVKKNRGRFNGWIGYAYSRTFIKMESEFAEERVNGGDYFPANYDKPHDFSAVINYKMTQRFSFSANFAYQTGRPITYPIGTYNFNNAAYTLYSDRNKYRIPDYYRLDIGFNYEGNHRIKKFVQSFWNLSIYNVLGRSNPYSVFFVTDNGQIKAYQSSIFSVPIPTISFNFKF